MACLLTSGRSLPCKNSVGGLKSIGFADYGSLGDLTITSGEVTAWSELSVEIYQFDIKGNSSLETTITSSRENGTTFYQTALNLTLPYLDKATQEEIKLLAAARPHVFVEDYNGNWFLVGADHGCEVTGGTIVSGAAMGDLSGFTLVMDAQEKQPPYFVDSTIVTTDISAAKIDPEA